MPRIDPIQLLNCLSVLLSPLGGIKSQDEVQRLAKLMVKFSKKLVSKCIYIQILKCTETDLLGLFMSSGGWRLGHMWLTESIVSKNWPLVKELLELLLLCPVDIEQLKTNNCPKLVKELSKDGNHFAIRALASKLVEQWLKTVKGEIVVPLKIQDVPKIIIDAEAEINSDTVKTEPCLDIENADLRNTETSHENESQLEISEITKSENVKEVECEKESATLPVLKISLKDGKQVISKVEDSKSSKQLDSVDKEKHKSKSKDRSHDRSSSTSSKSSSSKHSSSKSHSSSSNKHRSSSSSSKSKDRDKSREKEKDRESSSSSKSHKHSDSTSRRSSSSSNNSKSKDGSSKHSSDKDKNKEKNDKAKDSNEKSDKLQTPSIQKLGKIPKLSDTKREKPSISIEVRKPDEPKPKTVKTFHSKFRKHGLEEEIKPPPSRATILSNKKPPPAIPPSVSLPKRPSPVHNDTPPEKKPKTIEPIEKPGSIKLIPPKPKRLHRSHNQISPSRIYTRLGRFFAGAVMLLESDMFMDALTASTTNKKEPKKRKRRTSGSKDGHGDGSPTHGPTIPTVTSPSAESKSVPPRFYQDTLENDDNKDKEKTSDNKEKTKDIDKDDDSMDTSEPHTLTINGLKGVLCYHKRKGPKKSIKWKPDSELEEIQYFELDETERANVTKTFTDMKHLERIHEREAFQKGRNLSNDDIMEEKTSWRPLIPIDVDGQVVVEYGKLSKEKDIQAIRQKGTLQPLYFHKSMIPDSGLEPDPETHTYAEPTIIPLEDVTGNQDNISDFRNMPWPEPKGNAPPVSNNVTIPNNMFPPHMAQFPNGFPPAQFPGVPPGFQAPNMGPGDWSNGVPNMLPGPMNPMGLPPGTMPTGNMPPGLMVSPEEIMMAEMFGAPNPMFAGPPDGFNMQQGMFPIDFGMAGPQGPPGPDNFPGPGNFRGAMRGRGGNNGHWRGKGSGNWDGPPRGRGGSRGGRKTVCIYFQRKGSCRQGDNCTFLHPGVHCPY